MDQRMDEILCGVAQATFESLAFMFLVPPEDSQVEQRPTAAVAVKFEGPFSGSLMLAVSQEMLPQLAANMLGLDSGEEAAESHADALKELANVICGNLLPQLAGNEAEFNVSAPQPLPGGIDAACLPVAATARLILDCGQAELKLVVDSPGGAVGP